MSELSARVYRAIVEGFVDLDVVAEVAALEQRVVENDNEIAALERRVAKLEGVLHNAADRPCPCMAWWQSPLEAPIGSVCDGCVIGTGDKCGRACEYCQGTGRVPLLPGVEHDTN
jgi:hypothetical protein